MPRLHRPVFASCLGLLVCAAAAASPIHHAAFLTAANETSCSQEAKSSDSQQLAQARMQAARADLSLSRHGRCRRNALSLEQHAYLALEELTKEEQKGGDAGLKQRRLQAIRQTEAYLRTAEQDVSRSMKSDPQGNVGVDATALDNAMRALANGYGTAVSAETPPGQGHG